MHRQALGLKDTVLGKEHPSTLTSISNLATVLRDQGNYKQAEEMHRQELGLCEAVLGKEHPSISKVGMSRDLMCHNKSRGSHALAEV
jgi:hypothetical protein